MIILLDTSSRTAKLTIYNADGEEKSYTEWEADRQMARGLHRFIAECLSSNNASIHELSAIGVYRGPGSFTGLRIGLTVANTLADSLAIPIVGATADDWPKRALTRLINGENDSLVMPEYGGEANITTPRK